MRKFYWIVLATLFLVIASNLLAQDTKSGRLDMRERVFDFGLVPRDAKVSHGFILKNIGNDTLKINNIKPTCSCTTAPVDKKELGSQDSTIMLVTFASGKRSGNTEKTIEVTTNMRPRGLFPVAISAYVESPTMKTPMLTAEPRIVEYTPPDTKTADEVEITLTNSSESDMKIVIVDYPEELGTPKLLNNQIKSGKTGKLVFEFKAQQNLKTLNHSITLVGSTAGDESIRYTIPIVRNRPIDYTTTN